MKQYFQAGKHRLFIDHGNKTYCTNYFYLGGYESYVKIHLVELNDMVHECKLAGYTEF
jgi:hypothetical protein